MLQTILGENFQSDWISGLNTRARKIKVTVVCYIRVIYSCLFSLFENFVIEYSILSFRNPVHWTGQKSVEVMYIASPVRRRLSPSHNKYATSESQSRVSDISAASLNEFASSGSGDSAAVQQSSSNSSSGKASLSAENRQWAKTLYENLQPDQKWWLNIGSENSEIRTSRKTAMEDIMKRLALKYSHHQ